MRQISAAEIREAQRAQILTRYHAGETVAQIARTVKMLYISIDEKPGVQAIVNTAPDLPPVAGEHPEVARDLEYKRMGTCSIRAALDLHGGHITARVEYRHRSGEFIASLKDLDAYYPPEYTIRVIVNTVIE